MWWFELKSRQKSQTIECRREEIKGEPHTTTLRNVISSSSLMMLQKKEEKGRKRKIEDLSQVFYGLQG